jgi:hypothetical protein
MTDLSQLLVGGIPLLVVIFGLVEFIKSFGLKGNWLTGASLFLGLVFGFAHKIAESGVPSVAGQCGVAAGEGEPGALPDGVDQRSAGGSGSI